MIKMIVGGFLVLAGLIFTSGCGGSSNSGSLTTTRVAPKALCDYSSPLTFGSVSAVFSNNCGSCHDYFNYTSAKRDAPYIYDRVSTGSMPKPPNSLSAADKYAIEQWIACGAKQ